jgi:hypothetical protein
MIGHRSMGVSLLILGEIAKGRAHIGRSDFTILSSIVGWRCDLATMFGYRY